MAAPGSFVNDTPTRQQRVRRRSCRGTLKEAVHAGRTGVEPSQTLRALAAPHPGTVSGMARPEQPVRTSAGLSSHSVDFAEGYHSVVCSVGCDATGG
jgi:hypothetical protein